MPNWCSNTLEITGQSGVSDFLEAVRGESGEDGPCYLDFNRVIPCPETGWTIEEAAENWGCKWPASGFAAIDEPFTDQKAVFSFETPWSPPWKVIEAIGKRFLQLSFVLTFFEPMGRLGGRFCVSEGTTVEATINEPSDYPDNDYPD